MLRKAKAARVFWFFALIGTFFLLGMAGPPDASAQVTNHTITVTPPENGKITPITDTNIIPVADGQDKLFTITPNKAYHPVSITVDTTTLDVSTLNPGDLVPVGNAGTLTVPTKGYVYKFNFTNVTADHTITAAFAIDRFNLTVDKTSQSSGTGTVTGTWTDIETGDPESFTCAGDDCVIPNIPYNTLVTLEAGPDTDEGVIFEKWSGCKVIDKADNTRCTILVKSPKTVKARFTDTFTLTINIAGEGTGTVKGTKINCTGPDTGDCTEVLKVKAGSTSSKVFTLTAIPTGGSSFLGWTGGYTGTEKVIKVTLDNDKTVTASFGPLAGMQIANKVNVIEAKSGTTVKPLRIGLLGDISPPTCPNDVAYCNDETNVYVAEESAQTFNTINEILCAMAQSKYDLMLNEGPYKAQIDMSLCKTGKDDAASAGQSSQNTSSGASMPDYQMWTVDSSRPDDNSPHIVKAWIHQEATDYEPGMLINAKVVITEGVSEANPYGLFTVNFKGLPVVDGQVFAFTLMKGFMKTERDPDTGKVLLKFISQVDTTTVPPPYNQMIPEFKYVDKATLDKRQDGTGQGTVSIYELSEWAPDGDEVTYNLAFDGNYFHKMEPGYQDTEMCLDRNLFDESIWSYGLYNQEGSRVERNSGFSIKTTAGGQDVYGWIGYWGLWLPNDVTVNNGATVYKVNYGPGGPDEVPYTVLKSGGKLKKYTRHESTLGAIKNVPLNYTEGMGPQGSMYQVKWTGTDFTIFAKLDPMTYIWGPLSPEDPTTINLSTLTNDMLSFYSQALNGNVQVKLNYADGCTIVECPEMQPCVWSCPASDSTPVNTYTEDLVYPSDTVPASLVCFSNCPDATNLSAEDPFNHYDWEPQIDTLPGASQHDTYTFDTGTMVLMSGATPVVATNTAQNFQWGLVSGPLFDPTHLNNLACDMIEGDPNPDSTCGWKTWSELPEYYIWETGPNSWNQFTALKDGDTILEFEPPLQVSYVHIWEDLSTSTFTLEYSGFGNLNGIPGKCVDPDTGNDIPCGPESRWVPQFNIPEGAQVDDVVTATPYFVKPLDMEQRMKEADPFDCETLTLQTFDLPSINDFVDPNIGEEPVVVGPPSVIGGEVMY
jgi:hypothetical protein